MLLKAAITALLTRNAGILGKSLGTFRSGLSRGWLVAEFTCDADNYY